MRDDTQTLPRGTRTGRLHPAVAGLRLTRIAPLLLSALLTVPPTQGAAARVSSVSSLEASFLAAYSEPGGWSGELPGSQRNSIGFETLARLSSERGDFLTLNLQARVSWDTARPADDALALEVHRAVADLRMGLGRRLRAGHFSPEFGLEPATDTHATLLQTLAGQEIGFKKDWGIGYGGVAGPFDLGLALQLGSGMAIERAHGSFLATARASTPDRGNPRVAISLLRGDVLTPDRARTWPAPDYAYGVVEKTRLGIDAEYLAGPVTLLGEASWGLDGDSQMAAALLQADWSVHGNDRVVLSGQLRGRAVDLGRDLPCSGVASLSASYRVSSHWWLRMLADSDLAPTGGARERRCAVQAYFVGS
ncbi:MAG: hypothetical protein GF400_06860 [Candidatus Eisenbacteria bacterium]|nr:hypothetical protein [Candidatus Eisenbacteria bacterium]